MMAKSLRSVNKISMANLANIARALLLIAPVFNAVADIELSQQLKYNYLSYELPENSPAILSGGDSQAYNNLNYRFNTSFSSGQFDYDLHYEITALAADSHNLSSPEIDQHRLFQLTDILSSTEDQLTYQRLDRLSLTYKTPSSIFRVGRQAITWGNGLVFNTMDLFNPFSPTAIDKEYKPGDDMLYYQWLTTDGNDWQFMYLPRRDSDNTVQDSVSSVTAKYHQNINSLSFDFLIARHYDDVVAGIGLTHPLGQSMWRFDMTHTKTAADDSITSLSTNIDYSWTVFSKNIYGFLEYYYNGFGERSSQMIYTADLASRITRGDLFVHNRQYLAAGLRIEYHPLVNLTPNLIHNMVDGSSLFLLGLTYDWEKNLLLQASLSFGSGGSTSEFNGALSSGDTLQILLNYYF